MFVLVVIIIALFILTRIISAILKTPEYIGEKGEQKIARILNKLKTEDYEVINDLLLSDGKYSTQIDHLIVSIYGIFVIETKNYSGWIFGNEKSTFWTQVVYNKKFKFRNPIKQNISHVNAVKHILDGYKISFYPIVVFVGNAELKKISCNIPVIYESELLSTIIGKSIDVHLSHSEKDEIAKKLRLLDVNDNEVEYKRHIYNVQIKNNKALYEEGINMCPECHLPLVLRHGKYGDFFGLSHPMIYFRNYPV